MTDPTVPFTPGDVPLESYTLLSWARSGMAAAVTGLTAWDPYHAGVDIAVPVLGDGQVRGTATARLAVRGPGDVRALDPSQVIRCFPAPGTVGAEPNVLAHVEFDRPDLPWMFTPDPGTPRLRPWLALVVLPSSRWQPVDTRPGFPPAVSTFHSELQPLSDTWAWAHVQVLGATADQARIRDGLTDDHGLANLSRLLCPRRLEANTTYLAAVVPAYEIGRLAALGDTLPPPPTSDPVPPLLPAWQRSAGDESAEITLPLLHSWPFTTGERGDFQELAERLQPTTAPWYVGRRLIDTGRAFGGGGPGRLDVVTGPLVSPVSPDAASADPLETRAAAALAGSWTTELVEQLRRLLDGPADLADVVPDDGAPAATPRLGPPIYGDRHLERRRVGTDAPAWFGALNLEPRHRVVAGIGARVVQHDQELLMQAAWAQLDGLREANARIARAQLAEAVGTSLFERHVTPMAYGDLLQVSRPAHEGLTDAAGRTLRDAMAVSSVADMASTAAFRRLNRLAEPGALLADGDQPRDFQRPYDDRWVAGGAAPPPPAPPVPPEPTPTEFFDAVAQRNLDLLVNALPADPADDPVRVTALTRQLADLSLARNAVGDAARDGVLTITNPPDAAFTPVVRVRPGAPDELTSAIAAGFDIGTSDLADAVRVFVDPAVVAPLIETVEPALVAEAVEAHPEALAQYTQGAETMLADLAGAGRVAVVVPVGTGTEGEIEVEVNFVTSEEVAALTAVNTNAVVLRTAEVEVATPRGGDVVLDGADLPGDIGEPELGGFADGLGEATGLGEADAVLADDAGGELADGFEVGLDVVAELEQIALPDGLEQEQWLGQLVLPDPPDRAVAVLAPTILGDDELGILVLAHSPDDDLAQWLTDDGLDDDEIVSKIVAGCFEDDPLEPDQRLIDAILAWLGRKVLDPDDIVGICGIDMWDFLQNALWVHQSLPPIDVGSAFRNRVKALYDALVALTWPSTPVREPFTVSHDEVLAQLVPETAVRAIAAEEIAATTPWISSEELLAAGGRTMHVVPTFARPMHEALVSFDDQWILPGLADVPAGDLVTVVQSNPAFVEAFLVGLNHEMSRELLWRGYPADLRGTFFHRFWSHLDELGEVASLTDDGPLGHHVVGQAAELLVLVVRGEIVRRHPDLIAVAVRADGLEPPDPAQPDRPRRPLFAGAGPTASVVVERHRDPDVLIVGFDLTRAAVEEVATTTPDRQWWFLLAEHPAAPRFGLDEDGPGSWEAFSTPGGFLDGTAGPISGFGTDAARNAAVLLRRPVRAAFPVQQLLHDIDGNNT